MPRLVIAFILALFIINGCKKPASPPSPAPSTQPTTSTTKAAATTPAKPIATYGQLIKHYYPNCPSTQPLDTPVDLVQAARITLSDPIYLDRLQNMWITRPDAQETQQVLADAWEQSEHLVRERPAYVHWRTEPTADNRSIHSTPVLFCPSTDGHSVKIVEENRTIPLPLKATDYRWQDAISFNEAVIVAVAGGASAFVRANTGWEELRAPDLIDVKKPHATTVFTNDGNGILAYVPPQDDSMGSEKTARFTDHWTLLQDPKQWPGHFLDLIPLTDGTVLQIIADPTALQDVADHKTPASHLAMGILDAQPADSQAALDLIAQLNDNDAKKRQEAFQKLSVYGASLWPIIEDQISKQPDAVKEKLQLLLKNKTQPALGAMEPLDNRLQLVARNNSGGALFFDQAGVQVINADGDPTLVSPAWISVVPGSPIHLLIGDAWADITPNDHKIYPMGSSDWLVWEQDSGPHEIVGALAFAAILKPEELNFTEFVGADRNGRWLFRDPSEDARWLILDPTQLPVTPQLPVWKFTAPPDSLTGWDDQNWPVYRDKQNNTWAIDQTGFHLEDQNKAHFLSTAADVPHLHSKSHGATTAPSEEPLLVESDGTEFFGGVTELRRIHAGVEIRCPLPPEAKGTLDRPWLMRDKAGHLYLINQPGQIVRLSSTLQNGKPAKIDATFTQDLPISPIVRAWIDPVDRIVILHDNNQLAICFTQGIMPAAILDRITAEPK